MFFAAPRNGTAFSAESSAPLMTPFRRIVEAIVTTAMAAPTIGSDRDTRRDIRAPPHLATRFVIVMREERARRVPTPAELVSSSIVLACTW